MRIRGNNSLSLVERSDLHHRRHPHDEQHRLVGFGTGGTQPSRVGDINPDEIENIEIVKGPSAATLYGTDAANGVIVITTKKGRAGAARWNGYGEGGLPQGPNSDYPLQLHARRPHAPRRAADLPRVHAARRSSAGRCVPDSLRMYSPFHDPERDADRHRQPQQGRRAVSGGTEALRYFISGEREDEIGRAQAARTSSAAASNDAGTPIRGLDVTRPERRSVKNSFRANLNAALVPKLDLGGHVGNLITCNTRYTHESNATAGIGSQMFGGPGYKNNGNVCRGARHAAATAIARGRRATRGRRRSSRASTASSAARNANWRPFSWMPDARERRQRLHGPRRREPVAIAARARRSTRPTGSASRTTAARTSATSPPTSASTRDVQSDGRG